jgi:hypothetical protein
MVSGASQSVKYLYLTTILALERNFLQLFLRTTLEGEAEKKDILLCDNVNRAGLRLYPLVNRADLGLIGLGFDLLDDPLAEQGDLSLPTQAENMNAKTTRGRKPPAPVRASFLVAARI